MEPSDRATAAPGALDRAEYATLVAKLDAIPSLACPNFRQLRAQHPRCGGAGTGGGAGARRAAPRALRVLLRRAAGVPAQRTPWQREAPRP
jgi:hypothetical protein